MHRELITRTEYLAALNGRLRDHPAYVPGMRFVAHNGQGPETAAGFDWEPGDGVPPIAFAEAAAEVHALYRVEDAAAHQENSGPLVASDEVARARPRVRAAC